MLIEKYVSTVVYIENPNIGFGNDTAYRYKEDSFNLIDFLFLSHNLTNNF